MKTNPSGHIVRKGLTLGFLTRRQHGSSKELSITSATMFATEMPGKVGLERKVSEREILHTGRVIEK
jgi:hypothetical protein